VTIVYIEDVLMDSLIKMGHKYPYTIINNLIKTYVTRPHTDLFAEDILEDLRIASKENRDEIVELEQLLAARYVSQERFTERIEQVMIAAHSYVGSRICAEQIKYLNKLLFDNTLTAEQFRERYPELLNTIERYDRGFNLENHIYNISILKNLPPQYTRALSIVTKIEETEKKRDEYKPKKKSNVS